MKREMWWFYETLECPSLEISKKKKKKPVYLFECRLKQKYKLNFLWRHHSKNPLHD